MIPVRFCPPAVRRLAPLLITVACAPRPAAPVTPGPLGPLEQSFIHTRSLADKIDVTRAKGLQTGGFENWYREARADLLGHLATVDSTSLGPEDRLALAKIRQVTAVQLKSNPAPAVEDFERGQVACDYDPAALLRQPDWETALERRITACYGRAASQIPYGDRQLDRLTIFALLGETGDRAERERLFRALEPVWRSVNGDGSPASPWRQLLARRAQTWTRTGLPHVERANALAVDPDSVVAWLERVLSAWRSAQPDTVLQPWDWYHYTGAAERKLSARVPRERLLPITREWFRSLGADPDSLRIRYDLDPRPGKYPVAYTTFGDRPYRAKNGWWPGEPTVFATYRVGGLGNLVELLHETGHGIHIAGIRARPAFADWPDSDTFTEAVADLASLDAYNPRWQIRVLGDSVRLSESLRSKYGGVILDIAWALFEIRMFASPELDPNRVWADITSRYLQISPHPELSWWAMRGQLIGSPGYILNYALGSLLTAQLRERIRTERGGWFEGDLGWYGWVRDAVFRYGQERPASEVMRDVLGAELRPEALLRDLASGDRSKRVEEGRREFPSFRFPR
jgi:Carboxypeptidase Taq (M32) metallopeptidase